MDMTVFKWSPLAERSLHISTIWGTQPMDKMTPPINCSMANSTSPISFTQQYMPEYGDGYGAADYFVLNFALTWPSWRH